MSTGRRLTLGFGAQVVLAAGLGVSLLLGLADVEREFQVVVEHDVPVIANARHLSKLMLDMETGQRGFIITAREEFLDPYNSGSNEFDLLIAREKQLVGDNASQVAALDRIALLALEWKETAAGPEIAMARKVAAHRIDGEHLQAVLGAGVGKTLMDRFMALAHELELSFSERGDWEGAYVVEIIEKSMTDREDGQRGFLITGREEFLEKYAAGEQKGLPEFFARLRILVSERGRDNELAGQIDQLEALAQEWSTRAAEPEIAARREMNAHPETLKDVAALLQAGTGKALIDEIRREFDQFVAVEEELSAGRYVAARLTAAKSRRNAVVLVVIALSLGIGIAVATRRAIAHPLEKLLRGAEAVGTGDLATRVAVDSSDEIGDLARAFNEMVGGLSDAESKHKELQAELIVVNETLRDEMAERERLEEGTRVTQKIEAVGRLAGGIAHDFNNLLTTIGVYSELLVAGLPEQSPLQNEVGQIQKASRQAASLTQQLLTLGRRSHVQVDFLDLNEVVSEATSMLRLLLCDATTLELQLTREPQPIWGNIDQLQQILINVTTNARDAMEQPGVFSIHTSRCTAAELIDQDVASAPTSEEYVILELSDSGTGMSVEARERAFDPFFTTKAPHQGTGLGLSIVHGIVSQANGYVRIRSAPGAGTRLKFYWPLAVFGTEDVTLKGETPVDGGSEEILLVEDEAALRAALHQVLTNDGYTVTQAENGREAIEIARQRVRGFDLIVTDVVMPHMSGFELAEEVAKTHSETRVLFVSGHLNDVAIDHLPSEMPFLAKPFRVTELTTKVRQLLDERL